MTTGLPNQYIVGQPMFLEDFIEDPVTNVPIDDATDVVTVYVPDSTTETPTVTPMGGGIYSAEYIPALPGWYQYVWRSSGTGAGGRRVTFYVSPIP